jgi:predicted ATPase/DNA-binding winged helix-turn-helix (wHTH) protein
MSDQSASPAEHAISFGPFRLLPAQQLLLEDGAPVRLGSRAFDILTALVENAGELISKNDLISRVWPSTFIDENTLRVHIAGLRRALGDGQPGRRYLANVPGRGYRFVAPITSSEPALPTIENKVVTARVHNLPVSRSRVLGRTDVIGTLADQLPKRRFVTIVGAGGIGKTAVALALAETLLPNYADGVRFVDLAPVNNPQFISNTLGATLGLAIHPEDAIPQLAAFLRDKQLLIVFDSCEHTVEAAALLAEQLLAVAPSINILATSREPLRAEGERVHRLSPLAAPAPSTNLTAVAALAFPSVQLFVERAAAILDGFELNDADAPIVADICRKLGGMALAIELAAARVDAFGIRQLSVLLDDRFRILKQGKRTAQPRHQSLTAALDWSYEFLPEVERVILRRLSIFAGAFTLGSSIAVAGNDSTDVVEGMANLVAKSLVSADVSGSIVQYRLLDTTRVYALQKLVESGKFEDCARRHAEHYLEWFKRAEANWATWSSAEWLEEFSRRIDDIRNALNWCFSPSGDAAVGVALIIASIPAWIELNLLHECRDHFERALANLMAQPGHSERDELKLLLALGLVLPNTTQLTPENFGFWTKALALAESLGDYESQGRVLYEWAFYCGLAGDLRESLVLGKKCCAVGEEFDYAHFRIMGNRIIGNALFYLGDYAEAQRYIDPIVNQPVPSGQRRLLAYRSFARPIYCNILWLRGFPDQAVRHTQTSLVEAPATNHPLMQSIILAQAPSPIALYVGDLAEAERSIGMLLDCSTKTGLSTWNALGRCLEGRLFLARGDLAGLSILRAALGWLRDARFAFHFAISLGALAEGLTAAGQCVEARQAIDEALEKAESDEELWCMAELLRIKGEVLRLEGSANADGVAEDYFQQALDWSRRQGALSWELRAATSLAKLWRDNGKTAEAAELLSAVYDRFTEGFETSDLRAARALMDEFYRRSV